MQKFKIHYYVFALLCIFAPIIQAIETVIVQSHKTYLSLGYELQYIFDKTHQLSLEEIRHKHDNEWISSDQKELNFGFKEESLWVRVRLLNYSTEYIEKIIVLPHVGVDKIDCYIIRENNRVAHYQGGFKRLFSERKIKVKDIVLPVRFSGNESLDIYIKVYSEGPLSAPIEVWNQDEHYESLQGASLLAGIMYGAMVIMLLYNIFVFLDLKEKSYLYLSLYIGSLILIAASISNFGFQYLWTNNLWFEEKSFPISLGLLIMFSSLFVREVINTKKILSVAIKSTIVLGAMLVVISLVISYGLWLRIATPVVVFSGLVAAWVVIDIIQHGTRAVKYLVMGWGAFLLGFFVFFLAAFNIVPNTFLLLHGIEVGALIEILFLSLALIEQINQANVERDVALRRVLSAQTQTRIELEARVKDRTFEIENMIKKLEKANKKLTELSLIDSLTGLKNREFFDGRFDQQWRNAQRSKSPIALLFLDIDHFKRLNDEYGHLAGDHCLTLVATAIKSQVVRETDIVARYGGEEFIVLLPHTSLEDAEQIAEKVRQAVARLEPEIGDKIANMTISIGVAGLIPDSEKGSRDLIRVADLALYKAKKDGRNQVVVATEEMKKILESLTS